MARIALDAMGGDHAPQAPVAGALEALAELDSSHRVQLVGRRDVIDAELKRQSASAKPPRLEIVEADDVIEMTDKPSAAVKRMTPASSVSRIAARSQRNASIIACSAASFTSRTMVR